MRRPGFASVIQSATFLGNFSALIQPIWSFGVASVERQCSGCLPINDRVGSTRRIGLLCCALTCALALLGSNAVADPRGRATDSDHHNAQSGDADGAVSADKGLLPSVRARVYGNYETLEAPSFLEESSHFSEFDLRRADITITGPLSDNLSYRFRGDIRTGELLVQDAYVAYDIGPAVIQVGQFGPINELTKPAYRDFMEGSALEEAFAPDDQLGIALTRATDEWTFTAGAYRQAIDASPSQKGWTYAGRITFAPHLEEGLFLHLGSYFSWRKGHDGKAVYSYAAKSLLSTGRRYVTTGAIADEDSLLGLELSASIGSGSLESQCATVSASTVSEGGGTSRFDGCYFAWSWFLTGETRSYARGGFSMVDVGRPLFSGGPGAWLVGVRYDEIDLNDDDVRGGRQHGWIFALNWYLSNQLWLAADYGRTNLDLSTGSGRMKGMALRIHYQIRW